MEHCGEVLSLETLEFSLQLQGADEFYSLVLASVCRSERLGFAQGLHFPAASEIFISRACPAACSGAPGGFTHCRRRGDGHGAAAAGSTVLRPAALQHMGHPQAASGDSLGVAGTTLLLLLGPRRMLHQQQTEVI